MTPARAQTPPPPGRRARQKAAREQRILRAAEHLFARRGYAGTTMEDVARRARLAVGTLYNYFPSKTQIVLALLQRESAEALAAGETVRKTPPDDPVLAVQTLFEVYVDLIARQDRQLLRELLPAALAEPGPIARATFEVDLRLIEQLASLVADLQARGQLEGGVDPARVATTLYAVFGTWLTFFLAAPDLPATRFREEVRAGVALAMRGVLA